MKLHSEAVFSGRTHFLRISIETGEYTGLAELSEGELVPAGDAGGKLLDGVYFVDAVIAGEKIRQGYADIIFMPSGMVSPAVIHIAGGEGDGISLVIEGAMGRVRLVEGYFEETYR